MQDIKKIEQISMNAWPSLQTVLYDGWILRFANGVTRRANSVNPIYESNIDIEEKMAYCENIYFRYNLSVIYKMTSHVYPANLDNTLRKKGYKRDAETSVQTMSIDQFKNINSHSIRMSEEFDSTWLSRFVEFNGYDKHRIGGFEDILQQIRFRRCYLDVMLGDQYVGCGLGVLEDTFIGIFDIVVKPEYRKQGFGKMIVESLMQWGEQNGATTAYLQVMLNNPPALRLYERIGFQENYTYWYRIKPRSLGTERGSRRC